MEEVVVLSLENDVLQLNITPFVVSHFDMAFNGDCGANFNGRHLAMNINTAMIVT